MSYILQKASAFILAGGKSKRFGADKTVYPVNGKPLIEYVTGVLSGIFSDISIIADDVEKYRYLDLPCHPDIIPGMGPIGGIYTALHHSRSEYSFIVAGDMPGLNAGLIRYMLSLAGEHDVVVPFVGGNYEALHALYGHGCLRHVDAVIHSGERRIISFFDRVRVRTVTADDISPFARPDRVFRNINYLADIEHGQ
jgi:molybdenum cofactor guanylyltransferase